MGTKKQESRAESKLLAQSITMQDDQIKAIILNKISRNYYTGIRAGATRDSFLEIWMVVVQNRIFARSWGFAEKSWYHTFFRDDQGALKVDEDIVPMHALIPDDLSTITEEINHAYLTKYDYGQSSYYARKMVMKDHVEKTMEFTLD